MWLNGVKSPRFGSADEFAQLIPAVRLRDWVALAVTALCFGFLGSGAWRLPYRRMLRAGASLFSPDSRRAGPDARGGRVSVRRQARRHRKEGQLIGRVDQSDIRKRIEEDRAHVG